MNPTQQACMQNDRITHTCLDNSQFSCNCNNNCIDRKIKFDMCRPYDSYNFNTCQYNRMQNAYRNDQSYYQAVPAGYSQYTIPQSYKVFVQKIPVSTQDKTNPKTTFSIITETFILLLILILFGVGLYSFLSANGINF
jgi:hypothetical protein